MISKKMFVGAYYKEVQSEPRLCLKMFLLVMPTLGQKIKQVLRSRINMPAQVAAAVCSASIEV